MMQKLALVMVLILVMTTAACAAARVPDAGHPDSSRAEKSQSPSAPSSTDPSTAYDFSNPDRSCKVDADCEVKDVGNCCGKHPECVNKAAPTDPAKVKAQCAAEHRAGMCNVRAIGGCSCVQGKCSDLNPIGIQR